MATVIFEDAFLCQQRLYEWKFHTIEIAEVSFAIRMKQLSASLRILRALVEKLHYVTCGETIILIKRT